MLRRTNHSMFLNSERRRYEWPERERRLRTPFSETTKLSVIFSRNTRNQNSIWFWMLVNFNRLYNMNRISLKIKNQIIIDYRRFLSS